VLTVPRPKVVGGLESGCPTDEDKCPSFTDTDANATGVPHLVHQNGGFLIGWWKRGLTN